MPLLPWIIKLAPMLLSYGAKKIKAHKTSAGFEANPRATNGAVMTAIVTLTVALLGNYGVSTTGLETVVASVFGTVGAIYSWWRFKR